jgi:AraC-like DNA-binding protein
MKPMKQHSIPLHRMDARTSTGIDFGYVEMEHASEESMMNDVCTAHRDDYYLFCFLHTDEVLLTVDFEEMRVQGECLFYVLPGQVHLVSSVRRTKGWFLAIDAMLVDRRYRDTFEGVFPAQRPVSPEASAAVRIREAAHLLHLSLQANPTAFSYGIVSSLANVFVGIIAEQYAGRRESPAQRTSRSAEIACRFKVLLSQHFKTLKSPVQYADMLHYSLPHLNESVKSVTGFPVSYWIHRQVALEAKRLLYHTGMNVKEIAFALGYEDAAYFSRLFSKTAGMSPGAFRRRFHG